MKENTYEILAEIEKLIKANKSGLKNLSDLCSTYYTRVPHDFGMKVPPLIRSLEDLKKEIKLLEILSDIDVVTKLIDDNKPASIKNKIDEQYDSLNCDISLVTKAVSNKISQLIEFTHGTTHRNWYKSISLIQAFTLDGMQQNSGTFKKFSKMNRKLLWHGTRITNVASILRTGLRIAPKEAPVTGYMFGKGMYRRG